MDIEKEGATIKCSFPRMLVLNTWLSATNKKNEADRSREVFGVLAGSLPDIENIQTDYLRDLIYNLCKRFAAYWKKLGRSKAKIIAKYGEWLNEIEVCILGTSDRGLHENDDERSEHLQSTSKTPQYRKEFGECSKRSKRRRLALLSQIDDSAVNTLLSDSDQSMQSDDDSSFKFSSDEIVSLITEAKLTKHQYLLLKNLINSKIPNIFPSYQKVLEAKKRCYPTDIRVTESSAEINLQSFLDHTSSRIVESQKPVFDSLPESENEFVLIGKWGFDGSTGHSEYKQKFSDSAIDDSSLFVTSYVPLQLICKSNTSDESIIWKNPRPSSTRWCRPIRFQFTKESKEVSLQEETYFKSQIDELVPTLVVINGCEIKISHTLQLTMVDGKVCSALSDLSTSRCYICGATPKEMNDLNKCLDKVPDTSKYEFGLSPLHSYIRFFEYFIHVSYRINFKKWQARSAEDKASLAQRKEFIQQQFREKLGLIIDKPRSGGSGTSNDGNTARNFFRNSEISAEITGIRKDLIDRCSHLLQSLSSGYKINSQKFKSYAFDTAKMLVENYPWYNLPSSVHKVLMHGSEVIDNSVLSIGELSEEAAESCNKLVKLFRRDNTRKHSREVTNMDLMNRLLLNSDPVISSIRKLPCKKKSVLAKEVLDLLCT